MEGANWKSGSLSQTALTHIAGSLAQSRSRARTRPRADCLLLPEEGNKGRTDPAEIRAGAQGQLWERSQNSLEEFEAGDQQSVVWL